MSRRKKSEVSDDEDYEEEDEEMTQNLIIDFPVEMYRKMEEVSGSSPLCSSLRFFGEKTSAWQAFRRAKLNLFMGRSTIKSGGCHAIAREPATA